MGLGRSAPPLVSCITFTTIDFFCRSISVVTKDANCWCISVWLSTRLKSTSGWNVYVERSLSLRRAIPFIYSAVNLSIHVAIWNWNLHSLLATLWNELLSWWHCIQVYFIIDNYTETGPSLVNNVYCPCTMGQPFNV